MLKTNNNFKKRMRNSNQPFRNKGSYPGCAGCALRGRLNSLMQPARNKQRRTRAYLRNYGWILAIVTIFGLFSYLTFIPTKAFAAYDWETRTLSDITTMQEMNAKICENSEIEEEAVLEDTRDHHKYYVTKLKGDMAGTKEKGECWMTQNLAYNGGGSVQCVLSDSTVCTGWPSSNDWKARYAVGKHTNGDHYSQGNFYSWEAAMNEETNVSKPAQGICPDGWQLPIRRNGDTHDKSFDDLADAYGINDNAGGYTTLTNGPLYFLPGGDIYGGYLANVNQGGYYWTSTLSNNDNAYRLAFTKTSVYLSLHSDKYFGHSVRCVAADIYPEKPPITDNDAANVAITVSPVISIDVTKDANDMTVDFTKVATSTIIARVGSNQPYKVLLSTDKSDLTNPDTDKTIPMIPSEQTIVKGTSSWGIKKLSSPTDTEVNESTTYSPVGVGGQKELFYTSSSAASEDLTFPVAIAVDSSLPSGQYSTQVTLTAVAM